MTAEIITRYAHFMGFIVVFALLTIEHVQLKDRLTPEQVRRLAWYDLAYGIAALITLAAGLTLAFWVGKAAAFYTANPVFWTKLGLFLAAALISIKPTIFLIRHRGTDVDIEVPRSIVVAIRWELSLLVPLPLLGAMMSRGIGINWF